ncbi:MAG TPA: hypothetical protein VGO92_14715 [Acidimicrobiales bacterium]|nr:hypothetical protein [Acidimicrobiales bacterium]
MLPARTRMRDLDGQIVDVFSLLGVLLVFVFAFLTLVWSRADRLIGKADPGEKAPRSALVIELQHAGRLTVCLGASTVLVMLLLAPLSWHVVRTLRLSGPFHTVRAGLLLVQVALAAVAAASYTTRARLNTKIAELTPKLP